METSLDKVEDKIQIYHLHTKLFHTVKRLQKSVQYILRHSTKYATFFAVLPEVHKWTLSTLELLDQSWRNFYTIYRHHLCCYAHTEVAISHSISECQSDKWGKFAIPQNWLPWQRPLRYQKKRSRLIICTQNAFIRWKNCENRSIRSWDNCSPIIKKRKKERN